MSEEEQENYRQRVEKIKQDYQDKKFKAASSRLTNELQHEIVRALDRTREIFG